MTTNIIQIKKWDQAHSPSEDQLRQILEDEGLTPIRWSNAPHDVYAAHEHDYHKVILIVSGSITFGFPIVAKPTILSTGDRLDLPPHVQHNAVVGPDGVVCLEAHR